MRERKRQVGGGATLASDGWRQESKTNRQEAEEGGSQSVRPSVGTLGGEERD